MSRELISTTLTDFDGPQFPEQLARIHELVYPTSGGTGMVGLDGMNIVECAIATGSHHTDQRHFGETSDHYLWYRRCVFDLQDGQVVILFPWAQDWDKKDGCQSDRSTALYTTQGVKKEALDILLNAFEKALSDKAEALRQGTTV